MRQTQPARSVASGGFGSLRSAWEATAVARGRSSSASACRPWRSPERSRERVHHERAMLASGLALLALSQACSAGELAAPVHSLRKRELKPVPGVALDMISATGHGVLAPLGEHGWPLVEGADADPRIGESQRYYDALGTPGKPGESAPATFASWKRAFNFPPPLPHESLQSYRDRSGVVVYYNQNELGLGRELGCATFVEEGSEPGVACYVTNYGYKFVDPQRSLQLAVEGTTPKNTVAISYRPSLGQGNEVQFYVYDAAGDRQPWAQLDTLGPRPVPHVCMNCHGGSYDEQTHLGRFARFLPLDPNVVKFADGTGTTRAAQEERIRVVNQLCLSTPLTVAQRDIITQLYKGRVHAAGTKSATAWAFRAWSDTKVHRELFDQVVKPYCVTCHAAVSGADGSARGADERFFSPDLLGPEILPWVCESFSMPNAQPTLSAFWSARRTKIGGVDYPSAASALLAASGSDLARCANLDQISGCGRDADPDALCGNGFSGTACDLTSGRCEPDHSDPHHTDVPIGVCKTDPELGRSCPYPLRCVLSESGLEDFDGVCVP